MMLRRLLLPYLLSLLLGLTAQAMAQGPLPGAMGPMVICTGTGPKVILLSADGEPMPTTPVVCPDCVLSLALSPDSPNVALLRMQLSAIAPLPAPSAPVLPRRSATFLARAPPRRKI